MTKISIIVPVYNVEKYIERCLDSLLKQDLDDYEIIAINDGSTDNTSKILENYNDKIRIINQENKGVAKTRNRGLKEANGEYIVFVDSDDYVKENMLKQIYELMNKNNLDILVMDYIIDKNNNTIYNKVLKDKTSGYLTGEEYFFSGVGIWNKVYRRDFLKQHNITFPDEIIYEDLSVIPTLVKYNPKMYYLNDSFVYYFYSENSITRTKKYKKQYEDIFISCSKLYDSLINTKYTKELEYLISYHLLFLASLNFYKYEKYEQIDKISDFMKEHFPKWKKNKYIKNFSKKDKLLMELFYLKKYKFIKLSQKIKECFKCGTK